MMRVIFWEMILVLASVPVFRSAWHWMDSVPFLKTEPGFLISFFFGVFLTVLALIRVNRHMKG